MRLLASDVGELDDLRDDLLIFQLVEKRPGRDQKAPRNCAKLNFMSTTRKVPQYDRIDGTLKNTIMNTEKHSGGDDAKCAQNPEVLPDPRLIPLIFRSCWFNHLSVRKADTFLLPDGLSLKPMKPVFVVRHPCENGQVDFLLLGSARPGRGDAGGGVFRSAPRGARCTALSRRRLPGAGVTAAQSRCRRERRHYEVRATGWRWSQVREVPAYVNAMQVTPTVAEGQVKMDIEVFQQEQDRRYNYDTTVSGPWVSGSRYSGLRTSRPSTKVYGTTASTPGAARHRPVRSRHYGHAVATGMPLCLSPLVGFLMLPAWRTLYPGDPAAASTRCGRCPPGAIRVPLRSAAPSCRTLAAAGTPRTGAGVCSRWLLSTLRYRPQQSPGHRTAGSRLPCGISVPPAR